MLLRYGLRLGDFLWLESYLKTTKATKSNVCGKKGLKKEYIINLSLQVFKYGK